MDDQIEPVEEDQPAYCNVCGDPVSGADVFCAGCGSPLHPHDDEGPTADATTG